MSQERVDGKNYARKLRREQSPAEKHLWARLRGRRFCGFKFRRQKPVGPFVVDFVCMEGMLIVELDGRQHADSRDYDETRTKFLELTGFRVIRFWDNVVFSATEDVLQTIYNELTRTRKEFSHPGRL